MQKDLDEARIDAVKSATEIINGISRCLRLKDLDLLLINTLMVSQEISFHSITNEWSERNYRHVGLMYGGSIAMIAILLMMIGCFIYLPLVLLGLVLGRYIWLRRELTQLTRSRKWHHNTLKIARFLVLNTKATGKKTLFNQNGKMSIKYTMLRYIKDKQSISGASYLNLFAHINKEVDFYGMLHGVIDNVLLYAVEQEIATPSDTLKISQEESQVPQSHFSKSLHHTGAKASVLNSPPKITQKNAAIENKNAFTAALLNEEPLEDDTQPSPTSSEETLLSDENINTEADEKEEHMQEALPGTAEEKAPEPDNTTNKEESLESSQEEDVEESFSLDDLDDDDFGLGEQQKSDSDSESEESSEDEIDELLEEFDDDTLESLGLTEEDLK